MNSVWAYFEGSLANMIGSSHSVLLAFRIIFSFYLFLPEIDSCGAVTAGERDFFILRHGFLRGGIPIFLTLVGLGGDRGKADTQWCDGESAESGSNPETSGHEEFARSDR